MNILNTATAKYLLDLGLESLHEQSMEWISDIAFWRDEVSFLYALEVEKTLKEVPVSAKRKIGLVEEELVKMAGDDLDDLYTQVTTHERFLNHLLGSSKEDEETYREKHLLLAEKIDTFNVRLRLLKKEIFEIVKQNKQARPIK
jgi:hypothetical protein